MPPDEGKKKPSVASGGWYDLRGKHVRPENLPEPGQHVQICVSGGFVGEGYLKEDGKWYRYCDFGPVEDWMSGKVIGWQPLARPMTEKKP